MTDTTVTKSITIQPPIGPGVVVNAEGDDLQLSQGGTDWIKVPTASAPHLVQRQRSTGEPDMSVRPAVQDSAAYADALLAAVAAGVHAHTILALTEQPAAVATDYSETGLGR